MRGLNRITLIGHVGRDPELRTSRDGTTPWANFSLATGRSRKEGDQWVESTDWHRVKVYGTQAELCQRYVHKGDLICVEGSVVYDTWTAEDGTRRKTTQIMANRVTFLSKAESSQARGEAHGAQPVAEAK